MTFQMLNPQALAALLVEDPRVCLVDVRAAHELAQGRIAGALHVPLAELPWRHGELPRERALVFYCLAGARSAQACRFVAQQGFGPLYNLEGGIAAWARSGLALAF